MRGVFMVMKIDLKRLIKNLAIPLAVGLVSGFLTRGGVEEFNDTVVKPFFMPPAILFPITWTVLYIVELHGVCLALSLWRKLYEIRRNTH